MKPTSLDIERGEEILKAFIAWRISDGHGPCPIVPTEKNGSWFSRLANLCIKQSQLESRLAAAVEALKAVGRCECGDGSFHEWQAEKSEVVKVVCPQCNGTCYDPRAYAIIKSEESHEGK